MSYGERSDSATGPSRSRQPTFHLPYGDSSLRFSLPPTMQAVVAEARPATPLSDPAQAVAEALAAPVGSPPLRELARGGERACIVFTDITRACPDSLLVPALLDELEQAGVRDEDIILLCGTGLHRPSTPEEKAAKLGPRVTARYRVIDNSPQDASRLVDLGITPQGAPVRIHRAAVEADLLLSTGVVEPHQFAGYSGGSKTLAIGAAGEALIAHTHGPQFLDDPRARLGRVDDNPFQEVVVDAARRAGLGFILNVVADDARRILRVAAGHPQMAFRDLVAFARSIYEVPVPGPADIVIAGVGFPKDVNLYQVSRAASYLALAAAPLVRPGGYLIVPARCQEGAGSGVGEQRFLKAMRDAPDVRFILGNARRRGYPPGQQRAFLMAKVLDQARVVIVGSECPELVAACKMIPAATMDEALALAERELGKACRVLIVPHALLTLPVITQASDSAGTS